MNKGETKDIKNIHKEIQNIPHFKEENVGDINKVSGNEASEIYKILNDGKKNPRHQFLG